MFYVYHLIDPRSNLPFYVGKGTGRRAWTHLSETFDVHNPYKSRKIESIRSDGFEPVVCIIKDGMTSEEALTFEAQEILRYGRRNQSSLGLLTNLTDGGRGGDTSSFIKESTRAKWSKARKGTNNPQSKLTCQQVLEIYRSEQAISEIVEYYSISASQVLSIKRRKSYIDILDDVQEPAGRDPNSSRVYLTDQQVRDVFLYTGSVKDFKEVFGISIQIARSIKNRLRYKDVTCDLGDPGEIKLHKLTWDDVVNIRQSLKSEAELAKQYGVHPETVINIKLRKTRRFK